MELFWGQESICEFDERQLSLSLQRNKHKHESRISKNHALVGLKNLSVDPRLQMPPRGRKKGKKKRDEVIEVRSIMHKKYKLLT